MKPQITEENRKLYDAILRLETEEECAAFFEDICTIKELEAISQRLQVAKMLKSGAGYSEISSKCGASTATISRVNKCLLYGKGGYSIVIDGEKKAND
jgi:TrpR-related protein YerC/YecD